jgi:hypothetical protein
VVTSLESKADAARPTELLDDGPKEPLDATTNLVGFLEGGKDANSLSFLLAPSF